MLFTLIVQYTVVNRIGLNLDCWHIWQFCCILFFAKCQKLFLFTSSIWIWPYRSKLF